MKPTNGHHLISLFDCISECLCLFLSFHLGPKHEQVGDGKHANEHHNGGNATTARGGLK